MTIAEKREILKYACVDQDYSSLVPSRRLPLHESLLLVRGILIHKQETVKKIVPPIF